MNTNSVKLSLILNNFIFALLLSSVGIVILQMIHTVGIPSEKASILEAFKDLPIAITSFLIASYIPRFGYRRAMLTGLATIAVACAMMALTGGFLESKLLFLLSGVSFALVKISAYSTVGLITVDARDHASFMSVMEGFFMIGVLSGFGLFGWFIQLGKTSDLISWLSVYWVLSAASAGAFLLLLSTELDESGVAVESEGLSKAFFEMLGLMKLPLAIFFSLGIFIYVYVEQTFSTWLPSFNFTVLNLPDSMSVQLGGIYAGTLALGRMLGGIVMKRVHWFWVLQACLIGAISVILLVLPWADSVDQGQVRGWSDVPLIAFALPLIGFFLAPMYPTLSSSVLSALPKSRQSAMTGLIVIFSALGGTTGSIITGTLFGKWNGLVAFYMALVPIGFLILTLIPYRTWHRRMAQGH